MALRKFLRPVDHSGPHESPKVVNVEYDELRDMCGKGKSRGTYQRLSDEERATVGKFSSEHGVASTVRRFEAYKLAESSIRDWRNLYRRELALKSGEVKVGQEICIDALPSKKRGRPPLLGEKLDCHLREKFLA